MRRSLLFVLLLALLGVALGSLVLAGRAPAPRPAQPDAPPHASPDASTVRAGAPVVEAARTVDVPQRAQDALAEIRRRSGEPPPGHIGGHVFRNRERRLPRGTYREYDVNPRVAGRPRDAERIVIEQRTGKAYYSADHYETFTPMD